jgi:hypothetical protein
VRQKTACGGFSPSPSGAAIVHRHDAAERRLRHARRRRGKRSLPPATPDAAADPTAAVEQGDLGTSTGLNSLARQRRRRLDSPQPSDCADGTRPPALQGRRSASRGVRGNQAREEAHLSRGRTSSPTTSTGPRLRRDALRRRRSQGRARVLHLRLDRLARPAIAPVAADGGDLQEDAPQRRATCGVHPLAPVGRPLRLAADQPRPPQAAPRR